METGGWHLDPLGRHKLRWLTAGIPTRFVSDENGRVSFDDPDAAAEPATRATPAPTLAPAHEPAIPTREPDPAPGLTRADAGAPSTVDPAPAEWYPDPANPARLRYWDGSGWTGHILDQTPSA